MWAAAPVASPIHGNAACQLGGRGFQDLPGVSDDKLTQLPALRGGGGVVLDGSVEL